MSSLTTSLRYNLNERIKELAKQALDYANSEYDKWHNNGTSFDEIPNIRELYTEKFVELIVRECASIAWDHWLEDQDSSAQYPILTHFGVRS